ncbi:MAG: PTS IIA-like nitrogen regulatory protein PtsN [Porticoccaceae bacterium]
MKIADVLTPALTICHLTGSSKKRVLEKISLLISTQLGTEQDQSETVFNNFLARERLGSTGIGTGVAVPHCRTNGVKKIYGCLAKLDTPVDFDAVDDLPVDLVFALVVPEEKNEEHLATLARIAQIMQTDSSRQVLRNCNSNQELFDTIIRLENTKRSCG